MIGNNFIERSITGILAFLKDSMLSDGYALQKGFLQSLDPRVKIISFLLFILQVLFTRNLPVIIFFYAFCLLLAGASKINLGFFLKRTWFFIPLFSLCIALPAVFGPGEALSSWQILGIKLVASRQGLAGAGFFIMRVATCVSWAVLLNLTTQHFTLLKALKVFKIPQVFIMILGMSYRYIYFFTEMMQNIYIAIKSRVGIRVQYQEGQRIASWNIAALWNRSVGLNEEVYKAMLSRGYQGQAYAWQDFKIKARDYAWILASGMMIWIIRFLN